MTKHIHMCGPTYPVARDLTTEQAVLRLWAIRLLQREGGIDPRAAETALDVLRKHPNPRVSGAAGAPTLSTVQEFAR